MVNHGVAVGADAGKVSRWIGRGGAGPVGKRLDVVNMDESCGGLAVEVGEDVAAHTAGELPFRVISPGKLDALQAGGAAAFAGVDGGLPAVTFGELAESVIGPGNGAVDRLQVQAAADLHERTAIGPTHDDEMRRRLKMSTDVLEAVGTGSLSDAEEQRDVPGGDASVGPIEAVVVRMVRVGIGAGLREERSFEFRRREAWPRAAFRDCALAHRFKVVSRRDTGGCFHLNRFAGRGVRRNESRNRDGKNGNRS